MKKADEFISLHTKQDFQELMLSILEPLKSHYSEGRARLHLGVTMAHYDMGAAWMEAFSRPLWGLVPYWAGGGREGVFESIYQRGLCAGTDETNPEYWGECGSFDQRFVEMAAIAYGILFAPEVVWEPLRDGEKDNLCKYLNKINEHPLPVCNWILFAVLVNIAMKKVGRPYSARMLEEYLEGLETFYLGDGWYQDGDSGQKDYYVSFAIHFYSLVYAKVMEGDDPKRSALYKERAMSFAKQFIYWFDRDGDALPFGRSLTYRFSQVSFFSACLLAEIEPFPVPVMKGLIARHLRSWMKRPIFDRDGILTIGYGYPNLIMAERYNAPGSPYWGMKTFAFLMLPDEHPFWSAEEAPLPELLPDCPMPNADMYVRHYGNHVTAFAPGVYSPNGHGQIVAKYGKFAYDSKFGISVAKSCYELHENAPDNMLAFLIDGYVYVRRICMEASVTESGVYSKWSPYPGIMVETTLLPNEKGHIRTHRITSVRDCVAYDCGFAVSREPVAEVELSSEKAAGVGFAFAASDGWAEAGNESCMCRVETPAGGSFESDSASGAGEVIMADPNTNILYTKTAIPAVKYRIHKGEQRLVTVVTAQVKDAGNPADI